MSGALPAIVLGGAPSALAVIRSLGTRGVPILVGRGGPSDDVAASSRYVSETFHLPDDLPEATAVDRLIRLGAAIGGGVLIPTSDSAVALIASRKDELAAGFRLAGVDHGVARRFLDKFLTYELAREAGVPTPATFRLNRSSLGSPKAPLRFPCLLKPAIGHQYEAIFKRKWLLVRDHAELRAAFAEAEAAGQPMTLQEQIPGDEDSGANYNAYAWRGEVLVEFTSRKVRNAPPATGAPSVLRSESIPEIRAPGRALVRALDYSGFVNMEFKRDPRDGRYNVLDINGRHNLSAQLAVTCGVDFPWLQYRHLVTGEVPTQPPVRRGIYWIDLQRDVRHARHYLSRPDYSLRRFLRPYVHRHVFAVESLQDWRPSAVRMASAVVRRLPWNRP